MTTSPVPLHFIHGWLCFMPIEQMIRRLAVLGLRLGNAETPRLAEGPTIVGQVLIADADPKVAVQGFVR